MNPADPPPPLIQPHRPSVSSTTCDIHPEELFTGFCPSCLFERLTVLHPSSSLRKPEITTTSSTVASAIKASAPTSSSTSAARPSDKSNGCRFKSSFIPEFRRTQSFSDSKGEGFSKVFEPQRKSCDVKDMKKEATPKIEDGDRNLASSSPSSCIVRGPVVDLNVEEEIVEEEDNEEDEVDEIRVSVEQHHNVMNGVEGRVDEIVEEAIEEEISQASEELKTIKDHINLHSQSKKVSGRDFKEIAGSFWSAASVFSKKLQKWRRNQKMKKHGNVDRSSTLPVEKPVGRHYRETQSEIADYGFGRRSCDTNPRFSLDDPRYSFDEPRASMDGYFTGKTFPRLTPMLSVVEDAPVHHILRSDPLIQVEQPRISINGDDTIPGGSIQTRDYYSDSSSKRRSSVDRSNSIRKMAAAVVAEMDETKSTKVSPKLKKLNSNSNSNPLHDNHSDSFKSIINNGEKKESTKKSHRWSKPWNIWSLIHWRGGTKDEEDDKFRRSNGLERSFSASWQDFPSKKNGGFNNNKMFRSSSSVSWRNSNILDNSFKSPTDRNQSSRFSPIHINNGVKNRPNNFIAKGVLQLH